MRMKSLAPASRWGPAAVLAAAALVLAGCEQGLLGSGNANGDTGPIILGMPVPMSGSSAAAGPHMRNGAELAIEEINKDGGVLWRRLRLQVEDDACDPRSAVAAANRLVTSGVVASVGGYCSGATLPTLPVFAKAGVPMVIPAANSNELVLQRLPNVFLINGTGAQQAEAALRWIAKRDAARVAVVYDNTSYSKDIADLIADDLRRPGNADLAGLETITPGENDYSASVREILREDPDVIYFTGYFQEGGLLVRQLRQSGYKGVVIVADGCVDPKFVEIAGSEMAEGVFATMTQTPDTIDGAVDWIARYRERFGGEPGPYSTQSYDAVRVIVEAIRTAGSTDGDKVIAALEAIDDFQLFSGPLAFTPEHTLATGGFVILAVRDGNFRLADPLR